MIHGEGVLACITACISLIPRITLPTHIPIPNQTFNWQYYYYILTNDGIEFLRQYLALPAEIVPATLKKSAGAPSGRLCRISYTTHHKPHLFMLFCVIH
ncbi:hypothetical protein EON63_11715 [archaeon]|nr:MAG: hypothetical protein EON63_11715 [archaeon]